MSDWLNKENEEFAEKRSQQITEREYVRKSGYWTEIRLQVDRDVRDINSNPDFRQILAVPVTVESEPSGYRITKSFYPHFVSIHVTNGLNKINIEVTKAENIREGQTYVETLDVIASGESVALALGKEVYVVPEQASAHILLPVLRALQANALEEK